MIQRDELNPAHANGGPHRDKKKFVQHAGLQSHLHKIPPTPWKWYTIFRVWNHNIFVAWRHFLSEESVCDSGANLRMPLSL